MAGVFVGVSPGSKRAFIEFFEAHKATSVLSSGGSAKRARADMDAASSAADDGAAAAAAAAAAAINGAANGTMNGATNGNGNGNGNGSAPSSPAAAAASASNGVFAFGVVAQQPPTPYSAAAAGSGAGAGSGSAVNTPSARGSKPLPSALSIARRPGAAAAAAGSAAAGSGAASRHSPKRVVTHTPGSTYRYVQSPSRAAAAVGVVPSPLPTPLHGHMPSPLPPLDRIITPQHAAAAAAARAAASTASTTATPDRAAAAVAHSYSQSPSAHAAATSVSSAAATASGAYSPAIVASVKRTLAVLGTEFDPSADLERRSSQHAGRVLIDAESVDDSAQLRREQARRGLFAADTPVLSAALVPLPPAYGLSDDEDGTVAVRTPARALPPAVRAHATASIRKPASVLFAKPRAESGVGAAAAGAATGRTAQALSRGAGASATSSSAAALSPTHGPAAAAAAAAAAAYGLVPVPVTAAVSRLGAAVQELDDQLSRTETDPTREIEFANAHDPIINDIAQQIAALELHQKTKAEAEEAAKRHALEEKMLAADDKRKPLPKADEQRLAEVFAARTNKLLVEEFNIEITTELLQCLRGLSWLNDEVVNFYVALLQRRQDTAVAAAAVAGAGAGAAAAAAAAAGGGGVATRPLRCYFLNSFFYAKLFEGAYRYANVKRWSKKAKVDIFACDLVLIPVHIHNNHWTLATIDFRRKEFAYYDSMGGRNPQCLAHLRQYVADEAKEHRKIAAYDLSGWRDVQPQGVPQQHNSSDCGVFTLKFADYLSEDRPLNFSQRDMPYFRRRIGIEILNKRLL